MRVRSLIQAVLTMQYDSEIPDLQVLLNFSNSVHSTLDSRQVLKSIIKHISENVDGSGCSIVRIDADESKGYVVAINEDIELYNQEINFRQYPEFLKVIETRNHVLIEKIVKSFPGGFARDNSTQRDSHSVLLVPLVMKENLIGVLVLRRLKRNGALEERDIHFCKVSADIGANALVHAALFESLETANSYLEKIVAAESIRGTVLKNLHDLKWLQNIYLLRGM